MSQAALVYPMFAMVLLTFGVLVTLFRTRSRLVAKGEADPRYFLTYQAGSEPDASVKLARNFTNQFEAPVLFYVACVTAIATGLAAPWIVGLAWCYVAARFVHAAIHIGPNALWPRIGAYFASWIILIALWLSILIALARGSA